MVEGRHGADGRRELELLVSEAVDEMVPLDTECARRVPLLCQGDDFSQSDLTVVPA